MIEAILFDLDGTLVDTAPDMGGALNNLLIEENLAPISMDTIRPYVSQGGLVLTRLGFSGHVAEAEIEPLRLRFLQHYRDIVADQSNLFDGFEQVLDSLQEQGTPWGIVTNKPEWLTTPLLEQLGLLENSAVVICGDSLEKRKPHPLPLIVAAETIGIACQNCVYVGDDQRDIDAGTAANMKTLIAAYGYIEANTNIENWRADGVIQNPLDLLTHPLLKLELQGNDTDS
ncbi:MAG: phosphoglycolate phosphatase [Gammaproteobacteria bacterium]|jgi:phosphoglycolate phosphatase|nr:phosphoglycolate phosphatase [Gammaproteobacteria bacterium]